LDLVGSGEYLPRLFQELPFPLGYLVEKDLVFLCELGQRIPLTEYFDDDFGFEFGAEFTMGSFYDDSLF